MKKRIISLLLVLALCLGMIPFVTAAGHGMRDIVGHWAENDIAWVLDQGLFNGTSDDTFNPNGTMTRGMFVTVLGRYAGVDPADYQDWYLDGLFTDVQANAYYAPYINWAARHGITSGVGGGKFSPDTAISREQMATLLLRFANCYGYTFNSGKEDAPVSFDDEHTIAGYATEAVSVMRQSGVINGKANGKGGVDFAPRSLATRSECAAVFHRLMTAMVIDEDFCFVEPADITVREYIGLGLNPGDTLTLEYDLYPEVPSITTVLWVSSDPSVMTVDHNGLITVVDRGEAEIYAYTCNGLSDAVTLNSNVYIGYEDESFDSKCMNIFGKVVKDPRHPYKNNNKSDEFVANIVTIEVQVWDFVKGKSGEKTTKTMELKVHKNLAATVKMLFAEIYACEEQYPINYLGGYRWSSKSEHTPGLAIDINYESNPYVSPSGKVITGKKFDPKNDPYSIPIDGEVQKIFEKYGFIRGIYWSSGYKDYMHFSFFGT